MADKSWQIHPGQVSHVPPAVFDPADLERVTGFDPQSSKDQEWKLVHGGRVEHGPTVVHRLRDALLSRGQLILPRLIYRVTPGLFPWMARVQARHTAPAVLTATSFSSQYFGHWLTDELPLLLAAETLGPAVAPVRTQGRHQSEYLAALGLTQQAHTDTLFSELLVLDDLGQHDGKVARYQEIRDRLRAGREVARHPGVFLMRKSTGMARVLLNEAALADALRERGFRVLCPEEHSLAELFEVTLGAELVVGTEGSQLIHGLYGAAAGAGVLAFAPPYRFNNLTKIYCDALGFRYGVVVGEAREGGFWISPDAMLRRLDTLQRLTANPVAEMA